MPLRISIHILSKYRIAVLMRIWSIWPRDIIDLDCAVLRTPLPRRESTHMCFQVVSVFDPFRDIVKATCDGSQHTFPTIQHVPIMLVSALFSALVIVSEYTLFTLIHIFAYVQ